jgi:amidase
MNAEDIRSLPLRALAASLRRGELSSEAVVGAFLDRIAEVNPRLNAVVQLRADAAREEARAADRVPAGERGPLHGVPTTIKDSLDTAGLVTTGGTKGRASFVPSTDATVVRRLRAAGAIILGKTNTPDLTLSYETSNLVYGRTNNPFDLSRTSGGSSGGAAAIVAAGGSPMEIGSDTGGSIRLPAHCCGVAGLKPTAGRVPRTGHIIDYAGASQFLTHIGPLARRVDDLAFLLGIIAGPDGIDPHVVPVALGDPSTVSLAGLRVGSLEPQRPSTTAETVGAVESAVDALRRAGRAGSDRDPRFRPIRDVRGDTVRRRGSRRPARAGPLGERGVHVARSRGRDEDPLQRGADRALRVARRLAQPHARAPRRAGRDRGPGEPRAGGAA